MAKKPTAKSGARAKPKGPKGAPAKPAPKKKADAAENPKAVTGDNILTEDQARGLFFNHLKLIKKANAAVAEIEIELRAAKKSLKEVKTLVKAEGTLLTDIDTALRIEDGEEATIRGEIERQIRVAKWLNAPMGFQLDLLDQDRRPSGDKAFEEGKIAGLKGLAAKPPHDPSVPQHKRWMEGFHEGQIVLAKKFKPVVKTDVPEGSKPKDEKGQEQAKTQVSAPATKAPTPPDDPESNVVNLQQGGTKSA